MVVAISKCCQDDIGEVGVSTTAAVILRQRSLWSPEGGGISAEIAASPVQKAARQQMLLLPRNDEGLRTEG